MTPLMQTAGRSSQETERRHLLSASHNATPAPSAATSVIDLDPSASQTPTPRARSPAPSHHTSRQTKSQQSTTQQQEEQAAAGYRGFPSREAYLEALRQWAESKRYLEPQVGLQGFYGNVTMEEYAGRPGLGGGAKGKGLGLRRKVRGWKARREG